MTNAAAGRLTGHAAIDYAAGRGLVVGKYADPIEGERWGLTVSEARDIAAKDPGLIYLDTLDAPAVRPGFHLVPCPGDAHDSPYKDGCGMCSPRWGVVEVEEAYRSWEARQEAREAQADAAEDEGRFRRQIAALATEAAAAGDTAAIVICDGAFRGDAECRAECRRMLAAGRG